MQSEVIIAEWHIILGAFATSKNVSDPADFIADYVVLRKSQIFKKNFGLTMKTILKFRLEEISENSDPIAKTITHGKLHLQST